MEKPTTVVLYASQIAACIGYNKHKTPAESLESMWERMYPESYKAALCRTGMTTEADRIDSIASENTLVAKMIQDSLLPCSDSAEVSMKYDATSKLIKGLDVDQDDQELIDAAIKRNLYTNYGTASEHHALVQIRESLLIDAYPDDMFYQLPIAEVNGIQLCIGGKIDAITKDRSMVVEIKNRIRRLFHKIPFYEIVQVQCYLQLLNVSKGIVVECLHAQEPTAEFNVIPVARDTTLWNTTIVPKMKEYIKMFDALLTHVPFQDALITAPAHKKNHVLRKFKDVNV